MSSRKGRGVAAAAGVLGVATLIGTVVALSGRLVEDWYLSRNYGRFCHAAVPVYDLRAPNKMTAWLRPAAEA